MSSNFYQPGDAYYDVFTTSRFSTGGIYSATGTPVATAYRNGVADAGFVLTVALVAVGTYKITGTVPATYAADDIVVVVVTATVDSVAAGGKVDEFRVIADGAIIVTTSALASTTNKMTIVIGDDYLYADSRHIGMSFVGMPSISGATVTFRATLPDGTLYSKTMTVTSSTAAYLELAHAATALWPAGQGRYDVEAALATSADVVTVINRAELVVSRDVR